MILFLDGFAGMTLLWPEWPFHLFSGAESILMLLLGSNITVPEVATSFILLGSAIDLLASTESIWLDFYICSHMSQSSPTLKPQQVFLLLYVKFIVKSFRMFPSCYVFLWHSFALYCKLAFIFCLSQKCQRNSITQPLPNATSYWWANIMSASSLWIPKQQPEWLKRA